MDVNIQVSDPVPVYIAPVNEATAKWGVYCIPRMWRIPSGELVIRAGGEEDSCLVESMQKAPNLYFVSNDNGTCWESVPSGEDLFDYGALLGIDSPYVKRKDGSWIAIREKDDRKPIEGLIPLKTFKLPDGEAIVHSYRYGDIPPECKGFDVLYFRDGSRIPKIRDAQILFPEREILVNALAWAGGEDYVPVPQYLRPYIFKDPYLACIKELTDGTLIAVACGQHPDVVDNYCGIVYLLVSLDGGITWEKRGIIAEDTKELPYGYGGDGYETSLTVAENGDLLCVMRMDMSVNPLYDKSPWDTMLSVSHDGGFTWEKPVSVADCSVTPQIEALKDGIVFLAYGRPGVHFKVSCDNGKTWSESFPIIGKTLEQERAAGRSDLDSKYRDTCSYSNLFVEKISDDSVLVLYTDLKYDPGDGQHHKAGVVRKITITKTP